MIFNMISAANNAASSFPEFTYTGTYELIDDGKAEDGKTQNWRIKFLTSGVLNFQKVGGSIDVFIVGAGGGGGPMYSNNSSCGGGGGYTKTYKGVVVSKNSDINIVIGAGVSAGTGGTTEFSFNQTVLQAQGGTQGGVGGGSRGGSGGSGGGGRGETNSGAGGSDGADGKTANNPGYGGYGQGSTTREFGDIDGTLYSGGGGGGAMSAGAGSSGGSGGGGRGGSDANQKAENGATNTGGGGGGPGKSGQSNTSGGSGIIVIRNNRVTA